MPRALRSLPVACLCALALAACDEAPGAPDPFGDPPSIAAFALLPESVEALGTDATVTIEPTLAVTVAGGTGEVTLRALVRDVDGVDLLAEVEQSVASGARAELRPQFTVPRGAVGGYEVTVTAEDATGRAGDRASGVLTFTSPSLGPPEVTRALAEPETVPRPATGSTTVDLVADVADPDGLANLAYVELRALDGSVFGRFADDGRNGDAESGDGRYFVSLRIGSGVPVGEIAFDVVAVDRAGRESAPVPVRFTVS